MSENAPKKKLIELDLKKEFVLAKEAMSETLYILFNNLLTGKKDNDSGAKKYKR